jgi:hypothetical protein
VSVADEIFACMAFPGTDLTPPCCHSVTVTALHDWTCPNYQPPAPQAPAWVWYEDFGDDPSDYDAD